MDQELPRWRESTSSIESHNTDRDSPGTPTPDPHRFKDNSRPATSKAKAREHDASEPPSNIARSTRKFQSSSSSDGAAGTDGELSMTSSDLEAPASSNCSEHPVTKDYDQYDLKGFTPQDFDLLLTLAPADQLPDLITSEVKAEVSSSLPDGRSAVRIAINRYVIFHKFNQDPYASHTTSQRRDFERNVYDYARAYGLSKQEAQNEVRKARVIGGAPKDDSEDSSFGSEVDDTSEILGRLAKTTFSYRDIEREEMDADKEQMSKRVNRDRKKTRRGRKTAGEERNATEAREAVANTDSDGKGASGNANAESAKSHAIDIPSLTGSVAIAETRSSRRKRKRVDAETADDTTNQPRREAKKSKHFQRFDKKQSTTRQSRGSLHSNGGTMVDVSHEKEANKSQTTPTLPKETEKATKKQEKRKRRREKHAAGLKGGPHAETKKPREDQTPGVDTAQLPSAKVTDAKPSDPENLPPAERKKRNKRKSNPRDSERKVDAGPASSRPEDEASPKELAPNEPKSEQEAHQNFLRANIHDAQEESTLTADKTSQELSEAEGKQSKFIEKLDALKRFSNEKQLQLYDDGKYANADKQTKNDLKDLKEEKTTMEEMDLDTPKIDRGPDNKEKKKGRKTKLKRDKAGKVEESGGNDVGEIEENKGSSTRAKRRKRGSERQEKFTPEQAGFQ